MGINDDQFNYYNEQNRRINAGNYQESFPMIQAFEKKDGLESDPDWQNANGDYSVTPQIFEMTAFGSADAYVREVHMTMQTTGKCVPNKYGRTADPVLPNGVVIALFQKGEYRFVSPDITMNADYHRLFNGLIETSAWDGDCIYTATLRLDVPVILKGGTTDRLEVLMQDDLTHLTGHWFTATGWTTNLKEFQGE